MFYNIVEQFSLNLLFKRAEAYYFGKKYAQALDDLKQVAGNAACGSLCVPALSMSSKVHLLLGEYDEAKSDCENVQKQRAGTHKECDKHIDAATRALLHVQKSSNSDMECLTELELVLAQISPEAVHLRLKRAECALRLKKHLVAQEELKYVTIMFCSPFGRKILARNRGNIDALVLYAQVMYKLGAPDMAQKIVKDILKTDPDNRRAQQQLKLFRKWEQLHSTADKAYEQHQHAKAVESFLEYLTQTDQEPYNVDSVLLKVCKSYKELRKQSDTVTWCTKSINMLQGHDGETGNNELLIDAYVTRAESYLLADDFENAERDAQAAQQRDQHNRRVMELLHKIQRLKRMASRKDLYKILGVSKDSSKDEIKRAYRKMIVKAHPDRFTDPAEKQQAEVKFREITEAYEVLTDEQRRQRYDNGEDEDPQQQQHQQPFHHFGGGQTFTFNFGF